MHSNKNDGPSSHEAAVTKKHHSLVEKNSTTLDRRSQLPNGESLSRLYGPSLRDRLRAAIKEEGMQPPDVIELGELYQYPGGRHSDFHLAWCLLLKDHALFGNFDTGLMSEVTHSGVRHFRMVSVGGVCQ